jgi:sulfoxide reductase heme-binding subunit YedZ
MTTSTIKLLKLPVFFLCLIPFLLLLLRFWQTQRGNAEALGADPVATITHFTGQWALYMLLGSLTVTPLRRLIQPLAWLIRFRRMLGLFAFFYATLHLATYVFLFSGFDLAAAIGNLQQHHVHAVADQWRAIWPIMVEDVQKRRFIQVGLLAWFILLLLALTSPQWVMRKMGGKPWQTLHRTVYGAGGLAVLHYWWIVKKGVLEPWKVTAVLVVLLGIRIVWSLQKRFQAPKKA